MIIPRGKRAGPRVAADGADVMAREPRGRQTTICCRRAERSFVATKTRCTVCAVGRAFAQSGTPPAGGRKSDATTDLTPDATKDIVAALARLLTDVLCSISRPKILIDTCRGHISATIIWCSTNRQTAGAVTLINALPAVSWKRQIFATTDAIAERARKIGGKAMHSIGEINRLQRLLDNDADYVTPQDMLAGLCDDNKQLTTYMRQAHSVCEEYEDVAPTSLLENWIDEAETAGVVLVRSDASVSSSRD
jgi:starvation-inducible DNA-binding protein